MKQTPIDTGLDAFFGFMVLAIGLAAMAVILSNKATSANLITVTASGIASMLGAATAPVTGSTTQSTQPLPGGAGMPGLPLGGGHY